LSISFDIAILEAKSFKRQKEYTFMSNYADLVKTAKNLSNSGQVDHLGRALILAAYEHEINGKEFETTFVSLVNANKAELNTKLHSPLFSSTYTVKRVNFVNEMSKPNKESLYDLIIASFQAHAETGSVAFKVIEKIGGQKNLEETLKSAFKEYNQSEVI
jgi:hypothetical protein